MKYLKIKKFSKLLFVLFVFFDNFVFAIDVYDDNGVQIQIESGSLYPGNFIELYNLETREYRNVEIQRLFVDDNNLEIEVYDHNTGKIEYLETED